MLTAIETLERRIDELCKENEQLRQQVASVIDRSFRTADKMNCLEAENAKLRQENTKLRDARDVWQENDAKLRELVHHMHVCMEHYEPYVNISCDQCPLDNDAGDCDYERRMSELGIEVDE